jgi:hypothetical protein
MTMTHLVAAAGGIFLSGPEGGFPAEALRAQFGFHLAGFILAVTLALYACGLALHLLVTFLAPGITQRGADSLQDRGFRALLAGVAVDVVLVLLGVAASRVHPLAALALPLAALLVLGGVAVVAQDMGRRLFGLSGRSGSRLGRLSAGWAFCLLASAIPWLGWFAIGPVLLTMGMGGFVLALFSRAGETKPAAAAPPAPAVPPPAQAV